MSETTRKCFTCAKSTNSNLLNVLEIDSVDIENITFLDKLKFCFKGTLYENGSMEMCLNCVKNLRTSYNFLKTVAASQELSRQNPVFIKHEDGEEYCRTTVEASEICQKIERKTYKCEQCNLEFSRRSQLTLHKRRKHEAQQTHECSYCCKEFKHFGHLQEHLVVHTGEKKYACPLCDKQFLRQSSQKRHMQGHEKPPGVKTKRTPFLCSICGKSFPFSNGVQRHMRIHLGIRRFECHICNRKFSQSTHLQVHMRTHTGEKPYICDTCGEQFSLRACLAKHKQKKHCKSAGGEGQENNMNMLYMAKDFDIELMEYKIEIGPVEIT